jgi:hypothetical protein
MDRDRITPDRASGEEAGAAGGRGDLDLTLEIVIADAR